MREAARAASLILFPFAFRGPSLDPLRWWRERRNENGDENHCKYEEYKSE